MQLAAALSHVTIILFVITTSIVGLVCFNMIKFLNNNNNNNNNNNKYIYINNINYKYSNSNNHNNKNNKNNSNNNNNNNNNNKIIIILRYNSDIFDSIFYQSSISFYFETWICLRN